ncbi:hypothetical protein BOTNAR_0020g00510 [Botryotinia narcissicola]|uniref:Uncharacterized protein n=1 Tax=Botryotinia narcissicola TaxID=278944 RepID=A0A4Z1JIH5_9HELO|nr:hypothetical protein BOTNAR_0020g00510 [Botryotinia narcissicola]
MGNCSSKGASGSPGPAKPVLIPLQNSAAQPAGNIHRAQHSQGARPPQIPHRTEKPMSPKIRTEVLNATQKAFGSFKYGVIGGTALAQYGNRRTTSDVDVMVPEDVIDVIEDHLIKHGLVRTAGKGIGYVASDGNCYGIDITSDKALSQTFQAPQTQLRIMPLDFLLNSKAYSFLSRVGPDKQQKMANDAQDILFLLGYMKKSNYKLDKRHCRWVVDYDFWASFCATYSSAERDFHALGLQRDQTPSSSNRGSRHSSMEIMRRRSQSSGSW